MGDHRATEGSRFQAAGGVSPTPTRKWRFGTASRVLALGLVGLTLAACGRGPPDEDELATAIERHIAREAFGTERAVKAILEASGMSSDASTSWVSRLLELVNPFMDVPQVQLAGAVVGEATRFAADLGVSGAPELRKLINTYDLQGLSVTDLRVEREQSTETGDYIAQVQFDILGNGITGTRIISDDMKMSVRVGRSEDGDWRLRAMTPRQ